MTKIVKVALATLALLPLTVTQASAACFLIWCWSPGGGRGGNTPSAPEIDVTQGFAALAIVAVIALVLRERFLRARN